MITAQDIRLISKARQSKKKWADLEPEELAAYEHVHEALIKLGRSAKETADAYGEFDLSRTSGFSPKSGVRGSLPKDLWFALYPKDSDLGMPQIYLIVSENGLEYGFAPVIHPSDFSISSFRKRIRENAPKVVSLMPNNDNSVFQNLSAQLNSNPEWHIKKKSRQFEEPNEFESIEDYISFIKENPENKWWGAISRYVEIDDLESELPHIEEHVIETTKMFGPFVMETASNDFEQEATAHSENKDNIKDLLIKFMKEFPIVSQNNYGVDDALWGTMSKTRQQILNTISDLHGADKISVKHSVGKGNWAKVPWFAFLHSEETTTTEQGVYGGLLFKQDMSGVYLCLAMGVTQYAKEYSKKVTKSLLRKDADKIAPHFFPLEKAGFKKGSIDLLASTRLGQDYESSCVVSKHYSLKDMPNEDEIRDDIRGLISLYISYINNKPSQNSGLSDQKQKAFEGQRVWVMALGKQSKYLERFYKDNMIAIGWDYLGDLVQYQSNDQIKERMIDIEGQANPYNNAKGCFDFANTMSRGDLVFIKKGRNKIVGYGYVDGDYKFDQAREFYKHTRNFKWLNVGSWNLDDNFVLKTLTELTSYPDFVEKIKNVVDFSEEQQKKEEYPPYTIDDALKGLFMEKSEFERILNTWKHKKNVILQGPPGVGKTYIAKRLAYTLMGYKNPEQCKMVQFHQSYSYEDFIQGYRPSADGFELRDGAFYSFCQEAIANPDLPYVFIIDEINRGNLSKILGELMMLIERDKRGENWSMPLTYGAEDENFYVPENLFILGMMNTADRSLSMVDYALRRRFAFIDLEPELSSEKFKTFLQSKSASDNLVNLLTTRMQSLNDEIANDKVNLGNGFKIGHSFFCPEEKQNSLDADWYRQIVETEVIPLLSEYWFDDGEKVEKWRNRLLADI